MLDFLEKLSKMGENIVILNLSWKKEEEIIWCQNRIIILKRFLQKVYEQYKWEKHRRLSILELSKAVMSEAATGGVL